jgi:basic membrane protein A
MQRKVLLAGVASVALLLAACGGSSDTATETTPAPTEEVVTEEVTEESAPAITTDDSNCGAPENFCIGLITDTGKVDDKSFNQSAWEGTEAAAQAVGGFAKYIETTDPKDYASNIAQFVDREYDVIVTVGFLMAEATLEAAKANTGTNFIGVDQFQGEELPNLTGLVFPEDKAGYAAGYLAGLMTKTNKVGAVLGTDTVPPVKLFGEGYKAGVLAANADAQVTLVYHEPANAFTDPEWGAAEAQKQLAQGNDIIFGAGGLTGNGALIEIAKDPGAGTTIFCIGVDTDQYFTVPQAQKCLLTSAEKKLAQGTQDLVLAAFQGSFPGGNFFGNTGLAPYHDTESQVPEDVKAKVAEIIAGLEDGSIQTGVTL